MAGNGIVIQIQGDGESAKRALDLVQEKLHQTRETAEHEAGGIASAMERVKTSFETIGLYMGLREGIAALKEMTLGSFELGETLQRASAKTGLAVETLSTLKYAAATTGGDFEGLSAAVAKMDKTIGAATSGNKTAQATLGALGLNAKDLAGRTDGAEIAFKKFTETLAATENPIRRVQLATSVLGKAGADQIPMLIEMGLHWDEMKEKAERAGVYLSGAQAKALAETSQKLHDMQQAAIGAGLAFSEGLAPALNGILDAISGGKGTLDTLTQWGRDVGRVLAFVGELAYSTVAVLEAVFAAAELGKYTESGRKDMAAANELLAKAEKFHDIAFGDAPTAKSADLSAQSKGGGFEGSAATGKEKKGPTGNGIDAAQTALAEEQARAAAQAQQQTTAAMLAELDSQHKLLLLSDSFYYQEKLRLQVQAFDAERAALEKQETDLQALYAKQRANKLLVRDKAGNSAEELRTQREMLEVQERIGAVVAKSQEAASANAAEVGGANNAAELAGLKLAADLEKERNAGLTAQIALIRRKRELEAQKVTSAGGSDSDAAAVKSLGDIAVAKLQIAQVDEQIRNSEADNKRAVDATNDAAAKYPLLKAAAAKQVNQLNAAEAAQLQQLVAQYDALAAVLGGEYLEKAKDLHAEIDKLSRPSDKEQSAFYKTLIDGLEGISRKMADTAETGRGAFHKMAKSVEKDFTDLALKLAEQKFITPLLERSLGGGGKLPAVGGATGPSWPNTSNAAARGGILSSLPGTILGIGNGGGASSAAGKANVTVQIVNNSSSPVTTSAGSTSASGDINDLIIHTVLENASTGGVLSHLFSGGGG